MRDVARSAPARPCRARERAGALAHPMVKARSPPDRLARARRPSRSPSLESRSSALFERGDPLCVVSRALEEGDRAHAMGITVVSMASEHLLAHRERQGRPRGDQLGDALRLGQMLAGWYDLVDEPSRLRLVSVESFAGHDEVLHPMKV